MNPLELRQWAIECAITVSDDPDEILAFAARFAEFVENKPPNEVPTVERPRSTWGKCWTPERDALLLLQYPDAAFRPQDILRRINEMEGPVISPGSMGMRAKRLGVRRPADSPSAILAAKMRAARAPKRMAQEP